MSSITSEARYGRVARLLHWSIAALIVTTIPLGLVCASIGPKAKEPHLAALRENLLFWHKSIGVTVLILALVRIAWSLTHRRPPLPDHLPRGERALARAVHGLLYVLIIGMPLTGIVLSQAVGFPVSWFELFTLPDFVHPDLAVPVMKRTAVKLSFLLHERVLAYTLFVVLALHLAGLLKHQFIDRDSSIWRRMAPFGGAPKSLARKDG
jgi:cytochrome b561